MITTRRIEEVSKALEELVQEISVPDTKYEEASNSYEAVGDWLSAEGSNIAQYEPQIYPQGSFALGTAIRPMNGNDYDVDAVCLLQAKPENITQKELKELVGNRLKANVTYNNMLDPKEGGRRCWTLKYADSRNFHIDILPAIPDNSAQFNYSTFRHNIDNQKILLTDNTNANYESISRDWNKSNPQGYVNWFQREMEEKIKTRSGEIINASESVETIPIYKKKTTLQKAVQLLKKHRDIHYGNNEDKPISIIITTLATRAYNGESNLLVALQYIIQHMEDFIEKRRGIYWVENPTNAEENYADKWEKEPIKSIIFHEWLGKLKHIVLDLLDENKNISESIELAYGYSKHDKVDNYPTVSKPQYVSNPIFNVAYREKPHWPMKPVYNVNLSATFKPNIHGDRIEAYPNNGIALPKHGSLQFKLKTNVPKPYETQLQVVNTGNDAHTANNLRGQYFSTFYIDSDFHRESTLYKGKHMIQALIIKDGICVAKSEEFIVNIQ